MSFYLGDGLRRVAIAYVPKAVSRLATKYLSQCPYFWVCYLPQVWGVEFYGFIYENKGMFGLVESERKEKKRKRKEKRKEKGNKIHFFVCF